MLIKYVERLNGIAQHFVNMLMKKEVSNGQVEADAKHRLTATCPGGSISRCQLPALPSLYLFVHSDFSLSFFLLQ